MKSRKKKNGATENLGQKKAVYIYWMGHHFS